MTIELAKMPLDEFAYTLLLHTPQNENTTILDVLDAFLENNSGIALADVRLILAAPAGAAGKVSDAIVGKDLVHPVAAAFALNGADEVESIAIKDSSLLAGRISMCASVAVAIRTLEGRPQQCHRPEYGRAQGR